MKIAAVVMTLAIIFSFTGLVSKAEENSAHYKVRSEDTLWSIATEHETSVTTLKTLNQLSSNTIVTGQMLKVPFRSSDTDSDSKLYTVKSSDTLFSIARNHDITVALLMEINQLSGNLIVPGQHLAVSVDSSTLVSADTHTTNSVSIRQSIVDVAMKQLGVPYVWGGSTPDGFDCSGFVYYVFMESGLEINRTNAEDQHTLSDYVHSPQVGDLVFFENTYKTGISHVGIYVGNDQFIHANDGDGVQVTSLTNSYWQSKFEGFRRFSEMKR